MTGRAIAAVLVAVAVAAGACGGGGSDDGSGGKQTVIRFQFTGEPEEAAVYDLLIKAFEREHRDIDVRPTAIGKKSDHLAKLVTSFAGGSAPDLFLVNACCRPWSCRPPWKPVVARFRASPGQWHRCH